MGPYYRDYGYNDFRDRDAKLRQLNAQLSLAKLQRNKHRISELNQAIRRVH